TIGQKAATITGMTASNKTYDGTTAATLDNSGDTLNGIIAGDTVTYNAGGATGTFSDKNVANGKTVTAAGITLGGADGGNYALTPPPPTANITPAALSITANDINATYGSAAANTLSYGSVGLQNGETIGSVTLSTNATSSTSGNYNAGTWTVTASGATGGTF